jgi:hypothetical protein
MTKVGKVIVLFAITAMALTLPLAAQFVGSPVSTLESNTKKATAGVFSSSVDDYIDTRNWSGVSFEKWFGFATGDRVTSSATTNVAGGDDRGDIYKGSLGYAHKFGNLYLGAWYHGNILQMTGNPSPHVTKKIEGTDDEYAQTQTQTTTTTTYRSAWTNSTNQLAILLGVGKQGIKLGFFESLATDRNEGATGRDITEVDAKNGFKTYTNKTADYSLSGGQLRPFLGWGAVFSGAVTVKPYIDAALIMYQKEKIDNTKNYTAYNGKLAGSETTTHNAGWNEGYLMPLATVGSDFVKAGEAATTTVGIKYDFSMGLYDNNYDASGVSGNTAGTVRWGAGSTEITQNIATTNTVKSAELNFIDKTYQSHTLTPSYKVTGEPASGLKLGFRATLPVSFTLDTSDAYTEKYTINKTVYNNNINKARDTTATTVVRTNTGLTETTTITAAPTFAVGASYKLIPNHFTINAGIFTTPLSYRNAMEKVSPNGVNSITTSKKVDGNGVVLEDKVTLGDDKYKADEVRFTQTWNQFTGSVRAGFVFDFSPQMFLDLSAAAGTTDGERADFRVDITDVNVLFAFRF